MMKRYMNTALLYAILAMVGGVFYREFTKLLGYTARTTLGVVHTHYFLLGVSLVLLLVQIRRAVFKAEARELTADNFIPHKKSEPVFCLENVVRIFCSNETP